MFAANFQIVLMAELRAHLGERRFHGLAIGVERKIGVGFVVEVR